MSNLYLDAWEFIVKFAFPCIITGLALQIIVEQTGLLRWCAWFTAAAMAAHHAMDVEFLMSIAMWIGPGQPERLLVPYLIRALIWVLPLTLLATAVWWQRSRVPDIGLRRQGV